MLRDSLAERDAGHHVEQVEIIFAPGPWRARVETSWTETVTRTEALRIAFSLENGQPSGVGPARPPDPLRRWETTPDSWEAWRSADRHRPLLAPGEVPWRAGYWPRTGRFLWTFHHALLDGRSITTILRAFLARQSGQAAADLALAKWQPPTAEAIALADRMFRRDFQLPPAQRPIPVETDEGAALRFLGAGFRKRLDAVALEVESTTATLLIWAWGQALAEATGTDAVVVEQLRAGLPRTDAAGFTMLTLPVVIPRAADGHVEKSLREFRSHLLALRAIEGVSPADFQPGVFPDLDRVGSSVIMVEKATPQYLMASETVASIVLHEAKGETLMATAHLLPDLRLEVEGPGRHGLLAGWLRVLAQLVSHHPVA